MLGTKIDLKAMHPDILECKKAFFYAYREIERVDGLLSSHKENSEIAAINRLSGAAPAKVSFETFAIIRRAVDYSARFGGIFDPSIGSVTTLWGFNDEEADIAIPEPHELARAVALVNYRDVRLNAADTTVFLARKGMRLDLGGIAKGYAIDRAAHVLDARGLTRFLINAGGDIFARGAKLEGEKWLVGIQHPRKPNELLATFRVRDMAVATSGDYERFKIIDGTRYHHIMDPRSGFPAGLNQSVTVFAGSAEEADALATYLFVLGVQKMQETPVAKDIPACFVLASGSIQYAAPLKKQYELTFLSAAPKEAFKPN